MDSAVIEETALKPLVERFYDRVREDPLLGPMFASAIDDWPDHHARLTNFWSSVMLRTGRYKGNPVALHLRHADALTPASFDRWLSLWAETTTEMLPDSIASALQSKAARIAESLQLAIQYRRPVTA